MNAIPKSGGNTFHGSFLVNGSSPGLQSSNVNDRLRARGVTVTDSMKKLYDVNGAIGGPVQRDKTPDQARQAFAGTWTADNNIRLTWAPTSKQKRS